MDKTLAEVYRHERSKLQAISSSTKQEIDRNFEYVTGKVRDLQNKVRLVVDAHECQAQSLRSQSDQVSGMANKLQEMRGELSSQLSSHLNKLKQRIGQLLEQKEAKLQSLEGQVEKMHRQCAAVQSTAKANTDRIDSSLADFESVLGRLSAKLEASASMSASTNSGSSISKVTGPVQQSIVTTRQRLEQLQKKSKLDVQTLTKLLREYSQTLNSVTSKQASEISHSHDLQCNITRLTGRLELTETKCRTAQKQLQAITAEHNGLKRTHSETTATLQSTLTKLEQALRAAASTEAKLAECIKAKNALQAQLQESVAKLREFEKKATDYEGSLKKTAASVQDTSRENTAMKMKLAKLEEESLELKSLRLSFSKKEETYNELAAQLKQVQTQLTASEARKSELTQLSEAHKKLFEAKIKELQTTLSQQLTKAAAAATPKQKPQQSILYDRSPQLSKTQSIKCIQPSLNMQSSKASFKSEVRMQSSSSKLRISNKKQSSDEESNGSGFYYRQSTIKYAENEELLKTTHSSLHKKCKEDLPHKLAQLKDTLKASRKPLPLSCEIDETGYLKDSEQCTYIYDSDGNLFQLSKEQLRKAVLHRIIAL